MTGRTLEEIEAEFKDALDWDSKTTFRGVSIARFPDLLSIAQGQREELKAYRTPGEKFYTQGYIDVLMDQLATVTAERDLFKKEAIKLAKESIGTKK